MNSPSKTGKACSKPGIRLLIKRLNPLLEFTLLFAILFLLKREVLDLPYINDVALHVLKEAKWISLHKYWPYPPVLPGFVGHPPFFYEMLAVSYNVLGFRPFSANLVNVFFSAVCLYYTYLLGEKLDSKQAGITAALLLFFHPLYFAQSGIANLDMAWASLTIVSLYYALQRQWLQYFFSASCMVLTKEPAVVFFPLIVAYNFAYGKRRFWDFMRYMAPLASLLLWSVGNKLVYGWFLYEKHGGVVLKNVGELWVLFTTSPFVFLSGSMRLYPLLDNIQRLYYTLLPTHAMFLLAVMALFFILVEFWQNKRANEGSEKHERLPGTYALLFSCSLLFMLLYLLTASTPILIRYILPCMPPYFLAIAIALRRSFMSEYKISILLILFACVSLYDLWYKDTVALLNAETNMAYPRLLKNEKAALDYISEKHPDAYVLSRGFAFPDKITNTDLGYVRKPLNSLLYINLNETNVTHTEVLIVFHKKTKHYGKYIVITVDGIKYRNQVLAEFRAGPLYTYVMKIV